MCNIEPVELAKSYLLLNHGPVTLVSTASGGKTNVMAVSWTMPLDFDPPRIAVVIDRSSLTRELMEASGDFVINIPARSIADKVLAAGSSSGRQMDKFAAFGLTTRQAAKVGAPLIEGCVAWLECRIVPEPHNQEQYDLFIGEVLAAWADSRVFANGRWSFADEGQRTMHHISGGRFFVTGEEFELA